MVRFWRGVFHYAFIFLAFAAALPALAVERATVISAETYAFAYPDTASDALKKFTLNQTVYVSSQTRDGFRKAKIADKQYAWIRDSDLNIVKAAEPSFQDDDLEIGKLDLTRTTHARRNALNPGFINFRLGGVMMGVICPDFSQSLGLGKYDMALAPGGLIELDFNIFDRWRLGLRAFHYQTKFGVKHDGMGYDVFYSGWPILFGFEYDVIQGSPPYPNSVHHHWDISPGFYIGMSPGNSSKVVAYEFPQANGFEVIDMFSYAALINVAIKYKATTWFAFVFEMGGYYSYSRAETPSPDFNGSSPFKRTGVLRSYRATHLGPISTLGIQLNLF
jgi:hypothetical protein